MQTLRRLLVLIVALCVVTILYATFFYRSIPTRNTDLSHFDAIIVLGTTTNRDGSPSPEQRERTLEGVREYKAGIAPALIFTGGSAHNSFVESHVMANLAIAHGVPASAIYEEDQAKDTIQNIYYSNLILQSHHWTSAEVVSSPSHLPRTVLILQRYQFAWRTHAAPWPAEYNFFYRAAHYVVEAEYCLRLRIFGFRATSFLPPMAGTSH
jgi:uncharacterized SAM-binding protein YcdF (DUF218 family)